jgi:hypothetical protein
MKTRTGGCLCGDVRYELSEDPQVVGICHCKNCQRQAGSAFSIIAGYARDHLRLTGVKPATYEDKADSGSKVLRKFCARCGSPIISVLESQPDTIFVKAGTLDDTSDLVPQFHLWCDSAQSWYDIPDGIPAMEKQ